jgi:hypothetical protein
MNASIQCNTYVQMCKYQCMHKKLTKSDHSVHEYEYIVNDITLTSTNVERMYRPMQHHTIIICISTIDIDTIAITIIIIVVIIIIFVAIWLNRNHFARPWPYRVAWITTRNFAQPQGGLDNHRPWRVRFRTMRCIRCASEVQFRNIALPDRTIAFSCCTC